MSMILKCKSGGLRVVAGLMVAVIVSGLCAAQTSETDGIPTKDGVIQMTIPKGWSRVGGPGLAFFLRNGMDSNTANAWIYISSAPIGPNEEYRNFNSYVDYDVTTFRQVQGRHGTEGTAAIPGEGKDPGAGLHIRERRTQQRARADYLY